MHTTRNALRASAQRKGTPASVVSDAGKSKARIPSNRWVSRKLLERFADCSPTARALVEALVDHARHGPWVTFTCSHPQLEALGFPRTSIKRALRELSDPRREIYLERCYIPGGGDFSSTRKRYSSYRFRRRADWTATPSANDNGTAPVFGPPDPDELQWHEMRRQFALWEERERRAASYRAGIVPARGEAHALGSPAAGTGGEHARSRDQSGPLCVPVPPPSGAPVPGTPPNHSVPRVPPDPVSLEGTRSDDAPCGADSRAKALEGRGAFRDGHERAPERGVAPPEPRRGPPLGGLPPNAPAAVSPRVEPPSSGPAEGSGALSLVEQARLARLEREAIHAAQKRAARAERDAIESARRRELDAQRATLDRGEHD